MEYRPINEFNGIARVNRELPAQLRVTTSFTPASFHRIPAGTAEPDSPRPKDEDDVNKMIGGGGEWMYNTSYALTARKKNQKEAVALLKDHMVEDYGLESVGYEANVMAALLLNARRLRRARRGRGRGHDADGKRVRRLEDDADKKRRAAGEAETDAERKKIEAEEAEARARKARLEADQAVETDRERLATEADEAEARTRQYQMDAEEARLHAEQARLDADTAQRRLDDFRAKNPRLARAGAAAAAAGRGETGQAETSGVDEPEAEAETYRARTQTDADANADADADATDSGDPATSRTEEPEAARAADHTGTAPGQPDTAPAAMDEPETARPDTAAEGRSAAPDRPASADELRTRFDTARTAPRDIPGIRNPDFDARAIAGDVNLSSRQFRILDALGGRMGIAGDMALAGVIGGAAYSFTGDMRSGVRTGAETLPVVGSVMAFSEGRVNEGLVRTAEDASGLVLSFGGAAAGAGIGAAAGSFVPVVGTAIGFVVGGAVGLAVGVGASVAVSEAIRGAARLAGMEDVDPTLIETLFGDEVEAVQQLLNMRMLIREMETALAQEQKTIIQEMQDNIPPEEMETIERIVEQKLEELGEEDIPLATALRDPRIFFAVYEEYGGRMIDNPDDEQAVEIATYLESFLEQEEERLGNEAALLQLQQAEVAMDADEQAEYSRRYGDQVIGQAVAILNESGIATSLEDVSPALAARLQEGQFTGPEVLEITMDALKEMQADMRTAQRDLLKNNLSESLRAELQTRIVEEHGARYENVSLAEALREPDILRSITDHYADNPDMAEAENVIAALAEFEAIEIKRQDVIRSHGVTEQGYQRALQMQIGMDLENTAELAAGEIEGIADAWATSIHYGSLRGLYDVEERETSGQSAENTARQIEELYQNGSWLDAVDRARSLVSDMHSDLEAAKLRVLESRWDELNLDQFAEPPQNAQELYELLQNQETYQEFLKNQDHYFFNTSPRGMLEEINEQQAEIRDFQNQLEQRMGVAAAYIQPAPDSPPRPGATL